MSYVVSVERVIDAPRAAVFERLRDVRTWRDWCPAGFMPSSKHERALEVGDRVGVKIDVGLARMPTMIRVYRVETDRAIAWKGGSPAVMQGDHVFSFDDVAEGKTRVRSNETWTGVVASLLRPRVFKLAARLGREQLEGLAKSFA